VAAILGITAPEINPTELPTRRVVSVTMTEIDAERFRKEAEECRQQAEKTVDPIDKEAWLKLAADWMRLAQDADRRRSRC